MSFECPTHIIWNKVWLNPIVCVNWWTALLPLLIFLCRYGKLYTQRMVQSRRFQKLCSLRGIRLYICIYYFLIWFSHVFKELVCPCLSFFPFFNFINLYSWNFRCFIWYKDFHIMFNSILYLWFSSSINGIKGVIFWFLIIQSI